jgi:transcriptional regulator with XRE-family HTH domain
MTDARSTKKNLAAHLGATLRETRKDAELTQADVAEMIGVVTEVYGRMERGHLLPSLPTLLKVCRALRLDANTLLGFDSEKAPLWLVEESSREEVPEMRRLLRALHRMDAGQLAVMSGTATALLKYSGRQPHGDST